MQTNILRPLNVAFSLDMEPNSIYATCEAYEHLGNTNATWKQLQPELVV